MLPGRTRGYHSRAAWAIMVGGGLLQSYLGVHGATTPDLPGRSRGATPELPGRSRGATPELSGLTRGATPELPGRSRGCHSRATSVFMRGVQC